MLRHWERTSATSTGITRHICLTSRRCLQRLRLFPRNALMSFVVYGGRVSRLSCPPNALDGRGDYLWLNDEWRKRLTFIKSAFFGCWALMTRRIVWTCGRVGGSHGDWSSEWAL